MRENLNIPSSWVSCALGEVINYGQTTKAEPNEIPGDAWILELEDIEKDTSKLLQRVRFAQRPSKSTKNIFSAGDVLYGKLRPYLNKVLIADQDGYCSTEIIPLKPNLAVSGRFLFYWLKNSQFISYAEDMSHGLTMPRLSTKAGKQAPLVLAPLNEQKRISDKLDSLFIRMNECHNRLHRVKQILERFRQTVITAGMSGQLTQNWQADSTEELKARHQKPVEKLANFAEVIDPNPSHRYPSYVGGTIPLLATEQMIGENDWETSSAKLATSDFYEKRKAAHNFLDDDVIFARKGRLELIYKRNIKLLICVSST